MDFFQSRLAKDDDAEKAYSEDKPEPEKETEGENLYEYELYEDDDEQDDDKKSREKKEKKLHSAPVTGVSSGKENALSSVTHTFSPGDNVQICEGELINLQAKVVSVDGDMIEVMPKHEELAEMTLEFLATELKKYFTTGDHVKVVSGIHKGEIGLIVWAEQNRLVLFSDLSWKELVVLPCDLQLCPDEATSVESFDQFQWGDFVQLDPQTVGVILRHEGENVHVLSMHGKVVGARPQGLKKKRENKNTIALDSQQNTIRRRDIVKVVDGPHSGHDGVIKHLYRSFAFLHSKMFMDNCGIFVCKTRHLQLPAGVKANVASSMPSMVSGFISPRIPSPMHSSSTPCRQKSSPGLRRDGICSARLNRKLRGTTIKITAGAYKGNVGIVKDAKDSIIWVELHSSCQTIMVRRSHIANV